MRQPFVRYLARKSAGILILSLFVGLSALVVMTGPSAEPGERSERVWSVNTMEVKPSRLNPVLLAYGTLETRQLADVRSRIDAEVAEVLRFEGDWVEKGDVLLRLDPFATEVAMAAAEAARDQAAAALASVESDYALALELVEHHESLLAIAESRLERFRELHEKRMIADSDLDDMRQQASERRMIVAGHRAEVQDHPNRIARQRAILQEAETRYRQARRNHEYTELRAPVSGRVMQAEVSIGDRVSTGASLVKIADYEQLQLRVSLPGDQQSALREAMGQGQRIEARAELAGGEASFILKRLSGAVKPGQSGVDAFFAADPDPDLLLGRLMQLRVQLPVQSDVLPVPLHAIYQNDEVYRIEDSRLQAVAIERVGEYLDQEGNYRVLVRSPQLRAGDRLMTTQLPTAMTGLLVDPVDESRPVLLAGP